MVYVSKEPELFGGNIKVAVLVDGEEIRCAHCSPAKVDAIAAGQVEAVIRSFTQYLIKQSPNVRHTDIVRFRELFNNRLASYEVVGNHIELLRKHLPGGKLRNACHNKLRQLEELVDYRRAMAPQPQEP